MATKSQNSEIAVLQTQMEEVLLNLKEIKEKLEILIPYNVKVLELERRLDELEQRKTFITWVVPIATAVSGGLIAFLVQYAITHR